MVGQLNEIASVYLETAFGIHNTNTRYFPKEHLIGEIPNQY